ncbi:hypothetical protein C1H46_033404 [Malus baccata]|uniref:Terpene synthase metal-binding domain-containing protein n=1 Tax=Malus baccata TaxID=106549 RepID=A0A540L3J0_MALBA|nr:hypothetical protein C1H46_033404 [Malus baccata]
MFHAVNIFNKFKDGDGKFKESLVDDVVGLLSLYEATHLRIHGEEILDEALTFTTTHLESATYRLSLPLVKTVTHALNQQLRKGLPRIEARWWKDLDVPNKLPFVRDRLVEVYFCWSLSVYFQPQYSFARRTLCKVTAIISIIDDVYDAYGTDEELELFTGAIESLRTRGNYIASTMQEKRHYPQDMPSFESKVVTRPEKRAANTSQYMKKQVRGYFDEAKLFRQKHMPSLDEYICELLHEEIWSHKRSDNRTSNQVNNAWKDINEACLYPTAIPMPLLIHILNFARVMDVVYKCEDGYTNAEGGLKDFLVSTLVEPVAL